MKNYLLLLLATPLLFTSCSVEENTTKKEREWVTINGMSMPKEDVYTVRPKGIAPYGHKSYFISGSDYDLDKLDNLYRQEFNHPDSLALDYNTNVKNKAFFMLMLKGLAENGTPEQKRYYIDEQLKLDTNLSNLEGFNTLLLSSLDFIEEEEALKIADDFYDKNRDVIQEIKWKSREDETAKVTELNNEYKSLKGRLGR
ncbi:hypothetical protein GWA97_07040 [Flavobacterium sp. LaA7.5]|nr:hypothetical protein [Flavobacterium salilacus subsp. altitudinum]